MKYCGTSTPIKSRLHLSTFLEHCKSYATIRFYSSIKRKKSYRNIYSWIKIAVDHLFQTVDELKTAFINRHNLENRIHSGIDDISRVTLIVDTFPIYINRPKKDQDLFYNGKYKAHVLKVQVFCDNRANIVCFSGPHIGSKHDVSIFYEYHPDLLSNEKILADKAYCGKKAKQFGIVSPYKKKSNQEFQVVEQAFNQLHSFYRCRVEHAIAYLKRFQIISARHRGKIHGKRIPFISKVVKILIHLNYIQTHKYQLRSP